jgi:penicillin amidase
VNLSQETSGGDFTVLRGATKGTGDTPYLNTHAAAFRAVYDFENLDNSVYIQSTGQSGHPLSRHYDDLSETWALGGYIPMTLDLNDARAGAIGTTRLTPR